MKDKVSLKCWGEVSRERLPRDLDLAKIKQAKSTLVDEPLLPAILNIENSVARNTEPRRNGSTDHNKKQQNGRAPPLQPFIDSYIINTIKLNQILKSGVSFDQVDFFTNRQPQKKANNRKQVVPVTVNNDEDARHYMRQFVTIMCMHAGFTGRYINSKI
jgi:hypothetical protein